MVPSIFLAMLLVFAGDSVAGEDAYLQDPRAYYTLEPVPTRLGSALDRVGDKLRSVRNRILARRSVPRPGAQILTHAHQHKLQRLPGMAEERLLVVSGAPTWITMPGYLLRSGEMLEGRGAVIMPLRSVFDLHVHHFNKMRDRGAVNLVVEITNTNSEVVEVWLGGAIHSSNEGRGRWSAFGGYGGPAAATAEALLTESPRKGWSERVLHLHPGSKVRVITQHLPYGHEVDGHFQIDASAPVYLDVRAVDDDGSHPDDGVAHGWSRRDGCTPSGVYLGSEWRTNGDTVEIPSQGRGRAYALGAPGNLEQAPRGIDVYDDACRDLVGSLGVYHGLDVPLYNPSVNYRTVQLLISAPQVDRTGDESYRWVGPVMVNGHLQRVRLERAGHAEVLGAWRLQPGEVRMVHVDLPLPSSVVGPSALEVRTLD